MTFRVQDARKEGYSDDEILDYLSKDHPDFNVKGAKKEGYSSSEIIDFLNQPKEQPKLEAPVTLKGSLSAIGSGLGGGIGGLPGDIAEATKALQFVNPSAATLQDLASLSPLMGTHELTKSFQQQEPGNTLERYLQTGSQFAGQEGLIGTALGGPVAGGLGAAHGAISGIAYQFAKEMGASEPVALGISAAATISPIAARRFISSVKAGKSAEQALKIAEEEVAQTAKPSGPKEPPGGGPPPNGGGSGGGGAGAPPGVAPLVEANAKALEEIERLPSGLSKPRAIEAPFKEFATISVDTQRNAIRKLDEEASKLTQKAVEEHLPLAEEIAKGFDFEGEFQKNFGKLQADMEKYSPQMDITPISDLLTETAKKYHGLPTPHSDAAKILKEIKNFRNKPKTAGKHLLRIYRSNNQKLKDILDQSVLSKKQKEYSNFLINFNKAIGNSFKRTLPQDSAWLQGFVKNNKKYRDYANTQKSLQLLRPVLEGEITAGKINKIAKDPAMHKRLELSMGKEGADQVVQIAKDLKIATESIKSIPRKRLKAFDDVFPVGLLIPFVKVPVALYKGVQFTRNLYGHFLASPGKRVAFDNAVKAISEGNLTQYKKATDVLQEGIK